MSEEIMLNSPQLEIAATMPPLIGNWSSAQRFRYTRQILQQNLEGLDVGSEDKYRALTEPLTSFSQIEERYQYKIWRLNNCYNIVNKHGEKIPFVMNRAQLRAYLSLFKHKRLCILKSRQQGISTMWLVVFVDECLNYPDIVSGMISFKNVSQQVLLARAKTTYNYMEPFVRKEGLLTTTIAKHSEVKRLEFTNNSVLRIANSFVGSTLNNLHISELGPIAAENASRAEKIFTESVQTVHERGKVIIESTARGENKFSQIYRDGVKEKIRIEGGGYVQSAIGAGGGLDASDIKEKNPPKISDDSPLIVKSSDKIVVPPTQSLNMSEDIYYPVFLSWLDDKACRSNKYYKNTDELKAYEKYLSEYGITLTEEQRAFWSNKQMLLRDKVFAEYPAIDEEAFYISVEGTIYASHYNQHAHFDEILPNTTNAAVKQLDGKLSDKESHWNYDPRLPVFASFDLGIDNTFIIWYQLNNKKLVILREASISDLGVGAWSDKLYSYPEYKYESIVLPHDAMIRQKDEAANRVYDIMTDKGHNCQISTSKHQAWEDLRLVADVIPNIYINKNQTPMLHQAFLNYRKEHDSIRNCYLDKPRHDEHSHPMDSIRYFIKEYYGEIIGSESQRQEIDPF